MSSVIMEINKFKRVNHSVLNFLCAVVMSSDSKLCFTERPVLAFSNSKWKSKVKQFQDGDFLKYVQY